MEKMRWICFEGDFPVMCFKEIAHFPYRLCNDAIAWQGLKKSLDLWQCFPVQAVYLWMLLVADFLGILESGVEINSLFPLFVILYLLVVL